MVSSPPENWLTFEKSDTLDKRRLRLVAGTTLGLYPLSMYWLYTQWYKDYPQSTFHEFNDGGEWLQVDKVGHLWTAYNIAKPLVRSFEWAGVNKKKSTLYGCGIAYLYETTVEVFDGLSEEWGFSWPDMICNTIGVSAMASQELTWGEQRIVLKYSFHQTEFAEYRPALLGSSLPENMLKDYNGLTYWMCINPWSFMRSRNEKKFPSWLGLAIGYGAEGMIGGETNPTEVNGEPVPSFRRTRQYYISLDFDFTKVKWKSGFLKSFFKVINIIKLPAPTIEFNSSGKTKAYLFYF